MHNYICRYRDVYEPSRGIRDTAYTIPLKAVEIHIPKNFNVMYEVTHRALEYLGVLGRYDTWTFKFRPEHTTLVVYDKKGEKTQWVEFDLKQEVLLLYKDRYGSMVRTSELPRYGNCAVMFTILELIPTEEVIESVNEVEPVGENRDYSGEDESGPKNYHREYYSNDDGIEAIDIIERCHLHFNLGNVLKYLMRAGKKTQNKVSDYQKASWYIQYLQHNRSMLREQFEALEPYFDKSGAILQLVEDDVLNDAVCAILSIDSLYDTFPKFERLLKDLYRELDLAIDKEMERNLK